MTAVTKILAGGIAAVALGCAAPAAAQYYPGYGNGYGGGYGYGYNNGYGMNQQAAVNQCVAAVQQRLSGYGGYGNYGYSYGDYRQGRVLGISQVEPHLGGGVSVRGVASSGRYGGYGYSGQASPDLTWRCRTDYRGLVTRVEVSPAQRMYGYGDNYQPYQPYSPYDYSQYGYQRY